MKLAIIDLDMVVADNTKRFEKAEEAKQAQRYEKEATEAFWREAFNPELVSLDTPIEGAIEAVAVLERRRYCAVFLTSRPESMREATVKWLYEHSMMVSPWLRMSPVQYELIMKAAPFQYVKTVTWKAGMVQTLHRLYGADELLFIDDEEANRQAVLDAYPEGGNFGIVCVCASLTEAIAFQSSS